MNNVSVLSLIIFMSFQSFIHGCYSLAYSLKLKLFTDFFFIKCQIYFFCCILNIFTTEIFNSNVVFANIVLSGRLSFFAVSSSLCLSISQSQCQYLIYFCPYFCLFVCLAPFLFFCCFPPMDSLPLFLIFIDLTISQSLHVRFAN